MGSKYNIVEMFSTVQGEGVRTGARSVFCRLSGCNAWSGYEQGRERGKGACSAWCDTSFTTTNMRLSASEFVEKVNALWPVDPDHRARERWVVLTGGEPFLQVDAELLRALYHAEIHVAVETNGSVALPAEDLAAVARCVDLLTVSPKRGMDLDTHLFLSPLSAELKVVLPGGRLEDGTDGWADEELEELGNLRSWTGRYVQPQDPHIFARVGSTLLSFSSSAFAASERTRAQRLYQQRVQRCLSFIESARGYGWKISAQSHKLLSLP